VDATSAIRRRELLMLLVRKGEGVGNDLKKPEIIICMKNLI